MNMKNSLHLGNLTISIVAMFIPLMLRAQQTVTLEIDKVVVGYKESVIIPVWITASEAVNVTRSIITFKRLQDPHTLVHFKLADRFSKNARALQSLTGMSNHTLYLDSLGIVHGRELLGELSVITYPSADSLDTPVVIEDWQIITSDSISVSLTNGSFRMRCMDLGEMKINYKRVINNWPTIEVYITLSSSVDPVVVLDANHFKLFENGKEMPITDAKVPQYHRDQTSVSIELVVERFPSDSLNRVRNTHVNTFLSTQRNLRDEYSLAVGDSLVFPPSYLQKPWIIGSLETDPKGSVRVLDGMYHRLERTIVQDAFHWRVALMIVHGKDTSSLHTPDEIIEIAKRKRVRLFVVQLADTSDDGWTKLAAATGGYHLLNPDFSRSKALYHEMTSGIFSDWQEITLSYFSECLDGSMRTVGVQVSSPCGVSEIKAKSYRAGLDSSSFMTIPFEFGTSTASGWSEVTIPLLVNQSLNELMRPFTMTVSFDPSVVRFSRLNLNGTLLDGHLIRTTSTDSSVAVSVMNEWSLDRVGPMLYLVFVTMNPLGGGKTLIALSDWIFDRGCYLAEVVNGEIRVTQNPTNIDGDVHHFGIHLGAAYPNPVFVGKGNVILPIFTSVSTQAVVKLFDALGRPVGVLFDGVLKQGENLIQLSDELSVRLVSGMYCYRLVTDLGVQSGIIHMVK